MMFSTCIRKFKQSHFFFHFICTNIYACMSVCGQTSLSNIQYLFFYLSLCTVLTTPSFSVSVGVKQYTLFTSFCQTCSGGLRIYSITILGRHHIEPSICTSSILLGKKNHTKMWKNIVFLAFVATVYCNPVERGIEENLLGAVSECIDKDTSLCLKVNSDEWFK